MNFATWNGLTTHYVVQGAREGLPVVFINALGTDLRIWDGVVPHFTDRYLVIRFDKRGHGLSDCPAAPYAIRDFSNDLLGLLDHLDVSQAVVVGISVGGLIALDFTDLCPERVHTLVLCDTAPKIGTPDLWNERINNLRAHGMESMANTILSRWFAPSFKKQSPASYRGYYNMLTRTPVEGYTGTCEAIREADLTETTRMASVRALVLCGSEDISTPPGLAKEMAALLPNANFQEIANAGHLTCIEQPDVVAERIEQFL